MIKRDNEHGPGQKEDGAPRDRKRVVVDLATRGRVIRGLSGQGESPEAKTKRVADALGGRLRGLLRDGKIPH